jgi:hypothetical protein
MGTFARRHRRRTRGSKGWEISQIKEYAEGCLIERYFLDDDTPGILDFC